MSHFSDYLNENINDEVDYVIISEEDLVEYDLTNLDERIVKQRVVRGGRRKFKFQTTKPGFKVLVSKEGVPKEVLITPKEKIAREISQKKASRLRKVKQDTSQEKRSASIKKKEIIKKTSIEKKNDELIRKKREKEREKEAVRKKIRGDANESVTINSFKKVYYGV